MPGSTERTGADGAEQSWKAYWGQPGSVQLACDGKVIRVHAARHDPAKEPGAFATPNGRPRKPRTVA